MSYYIIKTVISAILIVIISEVAKVSSWIAAIITSLPIMSILAITWIYIDTKDIQNISELSSSIFWLVIPSLIFFIVLPILLKNNISFWISLSVSVIATASSYGLFILLLDKLSILK